MDTLKIAAKSDPNKIAGMMAYQLRKGANEVILQGIGAGATNQALKSIAIARGFLAPSGCDLVCIPAFSEIEINGTLSTALKLIVKKV